jgi:hypothetical protein
MERPHLRPFVFIGNPLILMFQPKFLFSFFLSLVLGGLFLFSAYAKLYPIELFEYNFVDLGVANWLIAPFIARLFIALEFGLGILLLLNFTGKRKWVYGLTVAFLALLSIYLIFIWITKGNSGNCGCFGQMWEMTPAESLVKNVLMISATIFLWMVHKGLDDKLPKITLFAVTIISLALPFILNVPVISTKASVNTLKENYPLEVDALYERTENKPSVDIRKDNWMVAFLSLTCEHCRLAAFKLHIIKRNNPDFKIFLVLNGEDSVFKEFMEETKADNLPYTFMTMADGFLKNSGPYLPSLLLTENGIVKKRVRYLDISESELRDWTVKP